MVYDSTFTSNVANASASGGAIYADFAAADSLVHNCVFKQNQVLLSSIFIFVLIILTIFLGW